MNADNEDRHLREAFATLRGEERARATSYAAILRASERQHSRIRRFAFAPIVAGIALFAVLGFIAAHEWRKPRASPDTEVTLSQWVEPTAFLLNTPGQEILRTVPAFGSGTPVTVPADPALPTINPRT
jgi:hypothetical protein